MTADSNQKTEIQTPIRDSDSGHGRASGSASGCSSEVGSETDDQGECFVDASDEILALDLNALGGKHSDSDKSSSADSEDEARQRQQEDGEDYDAERQQVKLSQRLEETIEILRKALNNEFVLALEMCSRRTSRGNNRRELYASLAQAVLSFLRAALTMEQSDLQAALESINQSFEISARMRRKTSVVIRFLYRPNYNTFTDDEIHAELVHAESLLMVALISFLADQNILCLVKGAFRIRACYQRYKECLYILETRREWESEQAKRHFESGVRMGHGIFNLLMSYLPRRVLRFLQYVGFSGNRSLGVEELERSVNLNDGLRSVFSTLVILAYHSYVENLFGLGSYDAGKVAQLNKSLEKHYPNSAFYLLFLGRYEQMQGNVESAIETFERCIAAQNDWHQFHSICHWEIMWCYAVQMRWKQAAHYADLLRKTSRWSPASYTYQYATFLYQQLIEDHRNGLCLEESRAYLDRMQEIQSMMRKVPELRIRYAGKTIPAEKFAITRSERFLKQGNRLTLPALEFLYIWNIFCTLRNSPPQLEELLQRIDSEIRYLATQTSDEEEKEKSGDLVAGEEQEGDLDTRNDNLSLLSLLKGMCLRHLHRYDEAEKSFLEVYENEHKVKLDTFLAPHALMELAVLNLNTKRYDISRHWIKLARSSYTGYLHETIVHFRLHAASRLIRMELQELELNGSTASGPPIEPSDNQETMPTTIGVVS